EEHAHPSRHAVHRRRREGRGRARRRHPTINRTDQRRAAVPLRPRGPRWQRRPPRHRCGRPGRVRGRTRSGWKRSLMKIGVLMVPSPRQVATIARRVEELGFDTLLLPDSQTLAPDVWQELALAASGTTRVHLGPGVSNSITRDPAVTATAALTLQVE